MLSRCRRVVPRGRVPSRSTTILAVRRDKELVVIGDGQVSRGAGVVKPNAVKLRRVGPDSAVVAGFAGSTADAIALLERLEESISDYPGQLMRASVALARQWRSDKVLRNFDAALIVADAEVTLYVGGNGDVLSSHDGVLAIGSGSDYALAAARALIDVDGFTAEEIARKAMKIAGDACVYTNHEIVVEKLESTAAATAAEKPAAK